MKINLLAQSLDIGGQPIKGPLEIQGVTGEITIADIISQIVKFLIPLAAIILVFVMIWGGYDFMMSQGSPDKLKTGKAKITAGLIGFVLLVLAYFITNLLAKILGFNGI